MYPVEHFMPTYRVGSDKLIGLYQQTPAKYK